MGGQEVSEAGPGLKNLPSTALCLGEELDDF